METIKIELKNGIEIVGTEDHKIQVLDRNMSVQLKSLGEISLGDLVVRKLHDQVWPNEEYKLPECHLLSESECRVPMTANKDFSFFVGALMSEYGQLDKNGFSIVFGDSEAFEDFKKLIKHLFNADVIEERKGYQYTLRSYNSAIAGWMLDLGISSDPMTQRVPACIANSTQEATSNFVVSYGDLQGGNSVIKNKQMALDFADLMWKEGLDVSIKKVHADYVIVFEQESWFPTVPVSIIKEFFDKEGEGMTFKDYQIQFAKKHLSDFDTRYTPVESIENL